MYEDVLPKYIFVYYGFQGTHKRTLDDAESGVTGGAEPQCCCLVLNPGPLEQLAGAFIYLFFYG